MRKVFFRYFNWIFLFSVRDEAKFQELLKFYIFSEVGVCISPNRNDNNLKSCWSRAAASELGHAKVLYWQGKNKILTE